MQSTSSINASRSSNLDTISTPAKEQDPVVFCFNLDKKGTHSLSKQNSSIARFVTVNRNVVTSLGNDIRLSNLIKYLNQDSFLFNNEMKTIVIKACSAEGKTIEAKIATLNKGLAFLETEKNLTQLVNQKQLDIDSARTILKQCLAFGKTNDFELKTLEDFNDFLANPPNRESITTKANALFNKSNLTPTHISHSENEPLPNNTKPTQGIQFQNVSLNTTESNNVQKAFNILDTCFDKNTSPIGDAIKDEINNNQNNCYDEKTLKAIQQRLEKSFGIDKKTFTTAWAKALSLTQGGKVIQNGSVNLTFDSNTVEMKMKFTPQAQLSRFPKDKEIQHCSSMYQSVSAGATSHAVNLWKQEITVSSPEGQKQAEAMSFLRHGYILEQETAAKEILANACVLQHGETEIKQATTSDKALTLHFSNIQLMSFGNIADKDKTWKQMEKFKKLSEETQPLVLTYQDEQFYVKLEPPLLFNFGVNAQHFNHLEIGSFSAKRKSEEQTLTSLRQLLGTSFPKLGKDENGNILFTEKSFIKDRLDALSNDASNTDPETNNQINQIKTLASQIVEIYQSHPEGLKDNPYALPTRVLALTHLLGFASSFNCKSGKDRTGVCAMELSNLCAQMMSGQPITNPMKPISEQEQKNLQAIYNEGSCVRDIPKINTGLQTGLKLGSSKSINKRFGVDLTKKFPEKTHPQK